MFTFLGLRRPPSRLLSLRLGLVAVGAVFAGLTAGCDKLPELRLASTAEQNQAQDFEAIDLTGAQYAQDFVLPDSQGKVRRLADFRGKVTVVFFGYTQCPDVCPTTLSEMLEVKKRLGAAGERLQVVFVTVDPKRDTPAMLTAYMASFDPSFVALRPQDDAQLAQVAKEFKVFYKRVEGKVPEHYTMDHSAGTYVFDSAGKIRLFSRYGSGVDALVHDLGILLAAK